MKTDWVSMGSKVRLEPKRETMKEKRETMKKIKKELQQKREKEKEEERERMKKERRSLRMSICRNMNEKSWISGSVVVCAHLISDFRNPRLFIDDDGEAITRPLPSPLPLAQGNGKYFRARNLVFNHRGYIDMVCYYSASCRDLMCFYSRSQLYVYSPSTNQYLHLHLRVKYYSEFKIGIVYIPSKTLYKIVLLELLPDPRRHEGCYKAARFTTSTLNMEEEGEHGGGAVTTNNDVLVLNDDDDLLPEVDETTSTTTTTSWEFVCKHPLPPHCRATLGNLIGIDGVVYAIINLKIPPPRSSNLIEEESVFSLPTERKVLSLDLEGFAHQPFKILNLPTCCYEKKKKRNCSSVCQTNILSQVQDRLCYTHRNTSSIDLWLLVDRNSCYWVKWYTISCTLPSGRVGPVYYFPPRPPTAATADHDDGGKDAGTNTILFEYSGQLLQHDMVTKKTTDFLNIRMSDSDYGSGYRCTFHVVADTQLSLKNGLNCTSLPPSSTD